MFNNFQVISLYMNKAIGFGIGIVIIAIAIILISTSPDEPTSDGPMHVNLSDEVIVEFDETKSFEVDLSENLDVGDSP